MRVLFFTRLFLYLLAFSLPVIHPSIPVPYDRTGWWMWFFLVPGEMFIGFYLAPPKMRVPAWVLAACGFLLLTTVLFSGFGSYTLMFIGTGLAAFLLTVLIFKTGARGYPFAVLEQFLLGFLYYKMLTFSRASESAALESSGITRVLLILIALTFLIHGMVLYMAAFQGVKKKVRFKELFLFLTLSVPVVLFTVLLLPSDFVTHSVVFNLLKREPVPRPIPLNEFGEGLAGGNLLSLNQWGDQRSGSDRYGGPWKEGQKDGKNKSPGDGEGFLEGIPAGEWNNMRTGAGGENKQYAVMILASSLDRVYAAESYFGTFDKERGFLFSREQELNDLTYLRFLETWKETGSLPDLKRYPSDIFYLSTLSTRTLAYRPYFIEPTVLGRKFHPFDFSYHTVSMISGSGPEDLIAVKGLSEKERRSLKNYLEVSLPDPVRDTFESHLDNAVTGKTGYFEKILAIFSSFSGFQYEIGFDDDISVAEMEAFLSRTRHGDCSEFSNTAAILTRMAGIPSRVVTGYLASKELQTLAHRRGIRILREIIEPLRDFPVQDLYLVTTAHRHSWIQLYIPQYGWIDFDPTSYAIPPAGTGNPNSMDVVIPLIQIEENKPAFQLPWLLISRVLIILLCSILTGLYLFRFGKELQLRHISGGQDLSALNSMYTLLLMKLSVNGYELKNPARTFLEYSKSYPEINRFASIYTELRYRELYGPDEKEGLWHDIRASYSKVINLSKKSGFLNALRRIFSLKGLYYIW